MDEQKTPNQPDDTTLPDTGDQQPPVQSPTPTAPTQQTNIQNGRILFFIAGVALGLAAQVIVIPIAIGIGLSLGELVTSSSSYIFGRSPDALMITMMIMLAFVLEAILVIATFGFSRVVRRVELFQGCLIGALVGWLLYSACWGLLMTSL